MAFRHLDGQANARANVRLGLLITFAGGLLFTFDLPLFRLAANAGGSAWDLIFARGVFLFLSISVIWWCLKQSGDLRTPYWGGLAGMGAAACNTIAPIAYLQAVSLTGAANVVFIIALIPLMTAALSRLFLGEPVHLWTWLAAMLSFAGIALIVRDSVQFDTSRLAGDALALVSCLCTAAAFTIIRGSGKNLATSLGIGSLFSALIALVWGGADVAGLPAASWMWAALAGLIVVPFATILLANGPRFLPAVDVSMFFLLETILTPLWIYLLFGETISPRLLAGGLIVVFTLLLHSGWRFKATLNQSAQEMSQ